MKSESELPVVHIGDESHSLNTLTQSYFVVEPDSDVDVPTNTTCPVVIHHPTSGERIETKVRTHVLPNKMLKCRFNDLSLNEGDKLKSWANEFYVPRQGDALNKVSYDDIAKGSTGASNEIEESSPKNRKAPFALSVIVVVLCCFLYLVGTTIAKSNYVALDNGAVIGNYHPIQASADGSIEKLNLAVGDPVEKGQYLFSISSPDNQLKIDLATVERDTCIQKVIATEQLIKAEERKLELVAKQIQSDTEIAKIEQQKLSKLLNSQQANVARMSPLADRRFISRLELKKETDFLKQVEADYDTQSAKLEMLNSRFKTIKEGKLYFLGGNVDNSLSDLQAQLILRKAELAKGEAELKTLLTKNKAMQVSAPRTGSVYAIYRDDGEYVEAKDAVLAINSDQQSWAFGTVSRNHSTKIKAGDLVRITAPAYNIEVAGTIASIGHRALYTEAGWSHDFRVDNSQTIPVKIALPKESVVLPTGTRIKMVIPLPLDWPWKS